MFVGAAKDLMGKECNGSANGTGTAQLGKVWHGSARPKGMAIRIRPDRWASVWSGIQGNGVSMAKGLGAQGCCSVLRGDDRKAEARPKGTAQNCKAGRVTQWLGQGADFGFHCKGVARKAQKRTGGFRVGTQGLSVLGNCKAKGNWSGGFRC